MKFLSSLGHRRPQLGTLPLVVLFASLGLSGCRDRSSHSAPTPPQQPGAHIRTEAVQSESISRSEAIAGTIRAKSRATLEAKISGRVNQLPVGVGQKVKPGDLLARLEAAEINARLAQAEATLEQAQRDAKRITSLFEQQAATRAEQESAESRLRVAQAAETEARAMLSYVEITAPFAGVVSRKWVEVGDLANPDKPLISVEDHASLQLEADVPQTLAGSLELEMKLEVQIEGSTAPLTGMLTEIAPSGDANSRTFGVKVNLPAGPGLKPGQFARLILPTAASPSLRIPRSALVQRGQLDLVFVVNDRLARMRLVKVGRAEADRVEILSGLQAGEAVVVEGAELLRDGQPVELK